MPDLDHQSIVSTTTGVVAIVRRNDQFLVIRRSKHVVAPGKICFPGGGVEPGETESQALCRELHEELSVLHSRPLRRVWRSTTPRGVVLGWWLTSLPTDALLVPTPAEVEAVFWATQDQLLDDPDLLVSNRHFFQSCRNGQFSLEHEL